MSFGGLHHAAQHRQSRWGAQLISNVIEFVAASLRGEGLSQRLLFRGQDAECKCAMFEQRTQGLTLFPDTGMRRRPSELPEEAWSVPAQPNR